MVGVKSTDVLGHTISESGITPSSDKVEAIVNIPPPKSLKKLQKFVGMVNFYNRFLPKIAKLLVPIYSLISAILKKKMKKISRGRKSAKRHF